jgi:hypothetical protein
MCEKKYLEYDHKPFREKNWIEFIEKFNVEKNWIEFMEKIKGVPNGEDQRVPL